MAEKKDIGELFENKLSEGEKIPQNSLWSKINTSLDQEQRRKKRIILFWTLGARLSLALLLLIINPEAKSVENHKSNKVSIENISASQKDESTFGKKNSNNNVEEHPEGNNEMLKRIINNDSSRFDAQRNNEVTAENTSSKIDKQSKKNKIKNPISTNKHTVDESFSVT